jgi:MoxR-like ATPase
MEERQVTIDAETVRLERPFLVLATQNPVEQEGTFPLPEAQLDRFLLKVKQGYPTREEEEIILRRFELSNPLDDLQDVYSGSELLGFQGACRRIFVEDSVCEYVVRLVRATRTHKAIRLGASPRAAQGLFQASRALAAINGRAYVIPDDVKFLASPVLAHRLIVNSEARLRGGSKERLVEEIVADTPVPVV